MILETRGTYCPSRSNNLTASPTVAPDVTAAPTQPLEDLLEQWVDEDRAPFEDPSSPQSLALSWLPLTPFFVQVLAIMSLEKSGNDTSWLYCISRQVIPVGLQGKNLIF